MVTVRRRRSSIRIPRDYRPGNFKFKSTPIGFKPTDEDLQRSLVDGIPGTAMPSFKLLPTSEVKAMVNYVKYLCDSRRNGTQAGRLQAVDLEVNPTPDRNIIAKRQPTAEAVAAGAACAADSREVGTVVQVDGRDGQRRGQIPPRPEMTPAAARGNRVKHGRELFYGTIANCVKCHGDSALGDGTTTDYDDWTKEFIGEGEESGTGRFEYVRPGHACRREHSAAQPAAWACSAAGCGRSTFTGGLRTALKGRRCPPATMKPEGDAGPPRG